MQCSGVREPAIVWGKILGGMAGFAMGGPFGAMMGAAFGHAAESNMNAAGSMPGAGGPRAFNFTMGFGQTPGLFPGRRDQLFAVGVVMLAAKVAKVDGPVKRVEIDAFKRSFRIPPESVRDIGHLFDQAREAREDPVSYATQMGAAFADNQGVLEDVLTALFAIARADGAINVPERDLLGAISRGFGLGRNEWDRASGARPRERVSEIGDDPYAILGIASSATPDELRTRWKLLMRENHPDSLASRGALPDAIAKASDKVARINAAWDRIKRDRNL